MELLLLFVGVVVLGFGAFSFAARREIGARDRWTCQNCGKQWGDGWMVHAAHLNHGKDNPLYDSPSNGRILCVACHIADHEEGYRTARNQKEKNFHAYAIRKLKGVAERRRGY